MPSPRAEFTTERRDQILEAAMICFAKKGFHQTSMHDISAEAGISVGLFGAAGVLAAFAGIYLFVTVAEALTALGLPRWVSYGIVTLFLLVLAGILALIGRRMLKKIEKPERTLETLSDLPDVLHRETPGQRRRAVPEVSNGRVKRAGAESYTL